MLIPTAGVVHPQACYPPVVVNLENLGYLTDVNQNRYSRDIGRSSVLAGRCYYVFGDTFSFDNGRFVGSQSNTAAIMRDRAHPVATEYLEFEPNGNAEALLQLNNQEKLEMQEINKRIAFWMFGGIVETTPGVGFVWYQKVELRGVVSDFCGVGIARVSLKDPLGQLESYRVPGLLFASHEPRIGSFSSLVEGAFIYLWGDHNSDIILARVPKQLPTTRSAYKFWNGQKYVAEWTAAVPVMKDMQHGAFFKSTLFGSERPWVFVGCSKWGDSLVLLAAENTLEGPWKEFSSLGQASGINHPNGYMYCMYPHPWAYEASDGELLVTWAEHWPGEVVAAKITLQMDEVRQLLAPFLISSRNLDPKCEAEIGLVGRYVAPGFAAPEGTLPLHVRVKCDNPLIARQAVDAINNLLTLEARLRGEWREEEEKGPRTGSISRVFKRVFRRSAE